MASPARAITANQERRRSERTRYVVKLIVSGYTTADRSFEEETFTISVNAHGALLALTTDLALGQRLLLSNPQNWDEREARVSRLAELHGKWTEVAVEFSKPSPEFWPIPAPPGRALSPRTHTSPRQPH